MSLDILFDNIIITNNENVARKWAEDSFEVKRVKIAEESVSIPLGFFLLKQFNIKHYNTGNFMGPNNEFFKP